MAKALFKEYFITNNASDKEIEVEASTGNQTLVIPNLRPDEAMSFLARRAFSSTNKSSSFRFFETREKYFFCTYEYLVDKYKDTISDDNTAIKNDLKFIYNTVNDNTGPGQEVAQQSVSTLTFGTKVNSIADIKNGNYRRRITELDYLNRTRITRDYDYSGEFSDFKRVDNIKQTHTSQYIDEFMHPNDAPETVLVADYPQIGQNTGEVKHQLRPYQYYYENYTIKPIVEYHMKVNSISTSIKGRVDMYPGKLITLELYEFAESLDGRRRLDTERTGTYLVTAVNNSFNGDEFSQQLTLTKGGLRGISKEVKPDIDLQDSTYNMGQGII